MPFSSRRSFLNLAMLALLLMVATSWSPSATEANHQHHEDEVKAFQEQGGAHQPLPLDLTRKQYAAKFVCGNPGPRGVDLATGTYSTVINVRNPSATRQVSLSFKISEALPKITPGRVTTFEAVLIPADGSVQIDCSSILDRLQEFIFADGFVVIQSREELDVVGVYTAAAPDTDGGRVTSFHTERVEPRLFEILL